MKQKDRNKKIGTEIQEQKQEQKDRNRKTKQKDRNKKIGTEIGTENRNSWK